ncbi:hypothetical protein ZEAMMB73_Zm00001d047338 [Zea mays]|uniref:Replication protein A 70 kDa DNA-binding subunit B/D first OB fold domain-containing protein n=1 Tax=Zea mays TaxID=4577 RepID=A0A1D6P8P6_MAIZE|nr:hypothetical protein ZEAMMB73_Zm00001d047338 [Zea mays]
MLTTMTTSQCAYFTDEYIQSLKASYPNRSYHGKPEYECSHCHAIFWYAERHIDMVLSDQEGNAIYAEIPANLVERKAPDIEEGGVYIISRFRVCAAKNAFKAVDGDKMIQFMFHTIVKRVMNPTTVFPTWYFNPKIPEAEPYHTSHQTRTIALQLSHALNHPPTIEHKQAIESKSLYELTRINPYDFPVVKKLIYQTNDGTTKPY